MTGPLTGPCGEVRLADGSRVTLRAVEPEDKRLLAAAFDGLSEQSRYRRFFTRLRELDERQLTYLTEVDDHDHEALLAIDPRSGNCSGVARFVRVAAGVAEPAIVVADPWQRLGRGAALLENRDAISLFETLGDATVRAVGQCAAGRCRAAERVGAGPMLRELLRAAATGLLGFTHRGGSADE